MVDKNPPTGSFWESHQNQGDGTKRNTRVKTFNILGINGSASSNEYVFSIPSGLKNAIEWCVSTEVFSYKPLGLITASANGEKGHEELMLIMQTVQTVFTAETTLLVPGIKGELDANGEPKSAELKTDLEKLVSSFIGLIEK